MAPRAAGWRGASFPRAPASKSSLCAPAAWLATPLACAAGAMSRSRSACRAEKSATRGAARWLMAPLLLLTASTAKAKIFPFQSDWDDLSNKYAPQFAPIKSSSSEVEVALAKHLTPLHSSFCLAFALFFHGRGQRAW